MSAGHDVTLAILAGGKGSRLGGVAKGLIEVGGVTVVQRLLDALGPLTTERLLVCDVAAPYSRFGLRAVPDEAKGRGAPGGLHSALTHAKTPWTLLVACDMPFVSARAVKLLRSHADDVPAAQFVCFERDGFFEPMPGLYSRSLEPAIGATLGLVKSPSLQQLLRASNGVAVPIRELRAFEPDDASLRSINTPEDLRAVNGVLPDQQSGGLP